MRERGERQSGHVQGEHAVSYRLSAALPQLRQRHHLPGKTALQLSKQHQLPGVPLCPMDVGHSRTATPSPNSKLTASSTPSPSTGRRWPGTTGRWAPTPCLPLRGDGLLSPCFGNARQMCVRTSRRSGSLPNACMCTQTAGAVGCTPLVNWMAMQQICPNIQTVYTVNSTLPSRHRRQNEESPAALQHRHQERGHAQGAGVCDGLLRPRFYHSLHHNVIVYCI